MVELRTDDLWWIIGLPLLILLDLVVTGIL